MFKKLFVLLTIPVLLLACGLPFVAPPAPAGTATARSSATLRPSATATITRTPQPRPTASRTPVPSVTMTEEPLPKVPQTRSQFERMVKAGLIRCLGYENGGAEQGYRFLEQAYGAGVLPRNQLSLEAGIPSLDYPSQCLYLLTVTRAGKTFLIYKDLSTGHYVKLPLTDAFPGGGQKS